MNDMSAEPPSLNFPVSAEEAFRERSRGTLLVHNAIAFAAIGLALVICYLYIATAPLNHDVAWLLTATQRWVGGQRLYVDIIEINPPLIFIETVILTGGLLTKQAYLVGVVACIGCSAAIVLTHKGPVQAAIAAVAMLTAGITDFGQRDHLALIFLVPLLLIDPPRSASRILIGGWAFLGVGLKPHFLLIPAAFVAARCWQSRSIAPLRDIQNVVLVGLCVTWLVVAALLWPTYFTTTIPLATFVYQEYGQRPQVLHYEVSAFLALTLILVALRHPKLFPLACAAGAAVAEFFLQGRFWSYHFVPVLGLTIIVCLQFAVLDEGLFRTVLLAAGATLIALQLWIGPHRYRPSIIPQGVKSVLFLSDRVPATYPEVLECGVTNTSRYPSFWTLPGAWNHLRDGSNVRMKAVALLQQEFAIISNDIQSSKPEIVFEDFHTPRYKFRPFVYSHWLNLSGYRRLGVRDSYGVWLRSDLDSSIIKRPVCKFRGVRTH